MYLSKVFFSIFSVRHNKSFDINLSVRHKSNDAATNPTVNYVFKPKQLGLLDLQNRWSDFCHIKKPRDLGTHASIFMYMAIASQTHKCEIINFYI